LISKIQGVLRYSAKHGDFSFVKIKDHECHEITVEELVDRYYKDPDRYFEFNGNNNGNNMPPPPPLSLPTLLPSLPLLLFPLSCDIQSTKRDDGSSPPPPPNLPKTAEQNYYSSKEEVSDEYLKNSKITNESQQISNESIKSIQI
jgi:hypothetical protein